MEKKEKNITISFDEYEKLKESDKVLDALYAGGVENWEWFEVSLEEYYDE